MTRLLTVEEVAERLGVTKDWVWAQARAGGIPHVARVCGDAAGALFLGDLAQSGSGNSPSAFSAAAVSGFAT